MRPNPGSGWAVILLLWCATVLGAAPYTWSVAYQKHEAALYEAVEVAYTCRFENEGHLYVIDFDPPKESQAYRMKLLREQERVESGRRVNEYRYVVFPQRPGELVLAFDAKVRKTTQASINNTVIGRDNVEDLDFVETDNVRLPEAVVEVRGHEERMTGTFRLFMEVDKRDVKAYEPVHVTLKVGGSGNFDRLEPFDVNISGVDVFTEAPEPSVSLGADGLQGEWVQRLALVSAADFTIPPLELRYYDTREKAVRTLATPSAVIGVHAEHTPETLLDTVEPETMPWEWKRVYLYYLLVFLGGIAVGRWARLPVRKPAEGKHTAAEIADAKTARELAVLLVIRGDRRFAELIEALECGTLSLAEAKKEAMKIEKFT